MFAHVASPIELLYRLWFLRPRRVTSCVKGDILVMFLFHVVKFSLCQQTANHVSYAVLKCIIL